MRDGPKEEKLRENDILELTSLFKSNCTQET